MGLVARGDKDEIVLKIESREAPDRVKVESNPFARLCDDEIGSVGDGRFLHGAGRRDAAGRVKAARSGRHRRPRGKPMDRKLEGDIDRGRTVRCGRVLQIVRVDPDDEGIGRDGNKREETPRSVKVVLRIVARTRKSPIPAPLEGTGASMVIS